MTFAPGETVQYVNVSVVNDGVVEGDEMFTATLTSTDSRVMIGSNNSATATIIDIIDSKSIDIKFIYWKQNGLLIEIYTEWKLIFCRN